MTEAVVFCKPVPHIYDNAPRVGVVFSMESPRAHMSSTRAKLLHGHTLGLEQEQTALLHESHARLVDGAVRQWRGSKVEARDVAKSVLVLGNSDSQERFGGAGACVRTHRLKAASATEEVGISSTSRDAKDYNGPEAGVPPYDPYPTPLAPQALATFHAAWQAPGISKQHQLEALFQHSSRTHPPSLKAATSELFLVGNS